jgi:quinone-modifying oxidoreductase subunit QmoA
MSNTHSAPLLVVGAGISGVTVALEAAEAGREVILVERDPSIGGRVLRSHNYFPKLCPPSCGMELNTRRLERNPRIMVHTGTTVTGAERTADGWSVTLKSAPAYVNARCTACDDCAKACPAKVADPFNLGLTEVPAIRLPHLDAWPARYTLDRAACPDGCSACVEACNFHAIDLEAKEDEKTVSVGAVVMATGWHPYPLENLTELGGGALPDVINNVTLERLASPTGPTAGKILRPSDGAAPQHVAFVQCAGSRDVNHLAYCSGICCLASMKQAMYVKEQYPETEVTIYYIDRRTPGRNETMLTQATEMEGVNLVKGKVGKIEKGDGKDLVLRVEDVEAGRLLEAKADLVVLATGMASNLEEIASSFAIQTDPDGFGLDNKEAKLFVAGVARRPEDVAASVRDATGAAAKACVAATGSAK